MRYQDVRVHSALPQKPCGERMSRAIIPIAGDNLFSVIAVCGAPLRSSLGQAGMRPQPRWRCAAALQQSQEHPEAAMPT